MHMLCGGDALGSALVASARWIDSELGREERTRGRETERISVLRHNGTTFSAEGGCIALYDVWRVWLYRLYVLYTLYILTGEPGRGEQAVYV